MSIKDKLRKQTEEAHLEFRKALYSDVKKLYDQWSDQAEQFNSTTQRVNKKLEETTYSVDRMLRKTQNHITAQVYKIVKKVEGIQATVTLGFICVNIFSSILSTIIVFFLLLYFNG